MLWSTTQKAARHTSTFRVTASRTAPLTYQWQKNGVNISGATSASYTTPVTTTVDSGSTFDVVVNNAKGSATHFNVSSHCESDSAVDLPVAEERREHQRSDVCELHHPSYDHGRQWLD